MNFIVRGTLFILFSHVQANTEWDLLIFTQNWPPTVCQQYLDEGKNHVCANLKSFDSWTVHGVWPTKLNTKGPGFCEPNATFNLSQLLPLHESLQAAWPSIEADRGEEFLWRHEWIKHGTCAKQLPALDTEYKYFSQGLNWLQQHNMTEILASQGILPSKSAEYPVQVIQEALINTYNVNPHIECAFEKGTKKPFLVEIRLCFDKSLKLCDCDGTLWEESRESNEYTELLTNCPLGEKIRYVTRDQFAPEEQLDLTATRAKMWRSIIEILIFLDWVI